MSKQVKLDEQKIIDFLKECSDGTLVPPFLENAECRVLSIAADLDVTCDEYVRHVLKLSVEIEMKPTL